MKPFLLERCPAQKDMCKAIAACTKGAIGYVDDEQAPLGGRIIFDYARCDGCADCVPACCGSAIEMRQTTTAALNVA